MLNSNSTSTTRTHRSSNPRSSSPPSSTSLTQPPKSTTTPPARTRNPKLKLTSNMNSSMSALMEEDERPPTPRITHREIEYGSSCSNKHDAHSRESTPGAAMSITADHSRSPVTRLITWHRVETSTLVVGTYPLLFLYISYFWCNSHLYQRRPEFSRTSLEAGQKCQILQALG